MKKTLVIMGTHPKSREKFDWKRTDCDIWLFNESPSLKKPDGTLAYPKADAVIQLHEEAIWKSPKNRSDEKHYEWLKSNRKMTVYMQKRFPDVPKSTRYPIEDILSMVKNVRMVMNGKEKEFKYFSSSPDYAMALAAKMWKEGKRYKRVEIWGIELEMESEYQYQRTGYGFWAGYLTALGIEVINYNSIFDAPMYGYEGDVAVSSKEFEKRIEDLTKELGEDKDAYTREANDFLTSLTGLLKGDVSDSIQKRFGEIIKHGELAGVINGKIKESQRYLEKAQAMEEVSGASVFSMGEFDTNRTLFNKQYIQVRQEVIDVDRRIPPLLKRLLNLKKGTHKRQRAIDEFGNLVAEFLNKNMVIFHILGAIQENQYYLDSFKLSIRVAGGGK